MIRRSPPVRALRSFAPALALALALASCGPAKTGSRVVLAIDEAFAAARPLLAAELGGDASVGGGRNYRPLALTEGPALALDAVAALRATSPGPVVLVASPLVAAALLGSGSWAGDPALVIAEWRGAGEGAGAGAEGAAAAVVSGAAAAYSVAASDRAPAYAKAGAACGGYIAALAREGAAPVCGVVFSSSAERPRNLLESFQSAFVEKAGSAALLVRELASPDMEASSSPLDAEAEAAVGELLGADIRVLFLAAGAAAPAALRAAARPGIAIGADYPMPETPAALAFRVSPDEKAVAAALRSLAKTAQAGSASAIAIPYLLTELPGASAFAAGGRNFGAYIRESAEAEGSKR